MISKVHIVNYGMGNLHSIHKKLRRLKVESVITSDPIELSKAEKLILPGVGHFKMAMEQIYSLELMDVLNRLVLVEKKPILGICLGMQLMADKSEEGNTVGLGWIPGEVVRFNVQDKLTYKVPHMGWNEVRMMKQSKLMKDIPNDSEFYFVHSYHYVPANTVDVLNTTEYDKEFVSAIEKENIYGVQYHPEKSHDVGELLFKNFIEL